VNYQGQVSVGTDGLDSEGGAWVDECLLNSLQTLWGQIDRKTNGCPCYPWDDAADGAACGCAMTRTRSVAAGVAVAFAVALGGWWAGARSPARPRPALATVYQLELEHDQRGRIELGGGDPGAPLRSRLVVRGALALGPATPVDGAWVRSMTLTSIEQWSAAFGEADVSAATQAAATGATARMVLDDRGAMIGLDVDPGHAPLSSRTSCA
jgi:hypothetical protein